LTFTPPLRLICKKFTLLQMDNGHPLREKTSPVAFPSVRFDDRLVTTGFERDLLRWCGRSPRGLPEAPSIEAVQLGRSHVVSSYKD
ncbi:MAG: hypothetical protein MK538_13000, partial [Planctomycetes bacterium]|nr:hypothetical protein [Planctomycetota bacterium]